MGAGPFGPAPTAFAAFAASGVSAVIAVFAASGVSVCGIGQRRVLAFLTRGLQESTACLGAGMLPRLWFLAAGLECCRGAGLYPRGWLCVAIVGIAGASRGVVICEGTRRGRARAR